MKKPTRYFVAYSNDALYRAAVEREGRDDIDPVEYQRDRSFDDLTAARAFAAAVKEAAVYERVNIRPAEDPEGLLWDWDERVVDDDEGSRP